MIDPSIQIGSHSQKEVYFARRGEGYAVAETLEAVELEGLTVRGRGGRLQDVLLVVVVDKTMVLFTPTTIVMLMGLNETLFASS